MIIEQVCPRCRKLISIEINTLGGLVKDDKKLNHKDATKRIKE